MIEYKLQQGNQDMLAGIDFFLNKILKKAIVFTGERILRKNQGKSDFDISELKSKTALTNSAIKFKEYVRPFIDMVRDTNDTSKYRILYNMSLKLIEYFFISFCQYNKKSELKQHFTKYRVSPEGATLLAKFFLR